MTLGPADVVTTAPLSIVSKKTGVAPSHVDSFDAVVMAYGVSGVRVSRWRTEGSGGDRLAHTDASARAGWCRQERRPQETSYGVVLSASMTSITFA